MPIFIFAFAIRFLAVWPANTIVGFDQARDFFDARKIILNRDLRIIGPTAGNNASLHHGVAFLYFIIPPIILGGGNPIWVVLWNNFFNAAVAVVLFFFARSLFKSTKAGLIAAFLTAVSYYFVQFSGWLSNPTVTLLTVPVFFWGLWEYSQGKKWGLPLASLFLGLSIQFELFFIYLIPTGLILWFILKPKFPNLKIFIYSLLAITFSLFSMILTEIKFQFAGVKSILGAGGLVGGGNTEFIKLVVIFFRDRWEAFYLNFWPQNPKFGLIFGLFIIFLLIFEMISKKKATRQRNLFLLVIFFSPAIMLFLGTHNAPWFLIGRSAPGILMAGYLISRIKPETLMIAAIFLIVFANLSAIKSTFGQGQPLLEPDKAAILSKQIAVMEYTYQKSTGEKFAIDTVTNPLYINAVWAWNYDWYWHKYGFRPNWLGGDQIPPYDTLPKSNQDEKYFFLIIDTTPRIPPVYTQNAIESLKKKAGYVEEAEFDGIKVIMWKNNSYKTNSKSTKSK